MRRRIWLGGSVAAALLVLVGIAVLWSSGAKSSWTELHSVAELRQQFNQDQGSTRIVLLLSPT